MSKNHTPGPWSVIVRPARGTYELLDEPAGAPIDERAANARLMDHAPALLAALIEAYETLADIRNEWPGRCKSAGQRKLCRIRNAIADASGHSDEDVQNTLGRIAAARGEG